MDMTQLDSLSVKQLEKLIANTLPGPTNHGLITPVLEAKIRQANSRRTWAITLIAAAISATGILVGYLIRK